MDTMILNEKLNLLGRHNQKLQAQILTMEDVSDKLQQLEELNRQLARVTHCLTFLWHPEWKGACLCAIRMPAIHDATAQDAASTHTGH